MLTIAAATLLVTASIALVGNQGANASTTGSIPLAANAAKCLDHDVSSGRLQVWDCLGYSNQNWTFADDGSLRDSSGCMEVPANATANGTLVRVNPCDGSVQQQWVINSKSGTIENVLTDKCLDIPYGTQTNGTQVQLWTCLGNGNQTFSGSNVARSKWTAAFASAIQEAPMLTNASNFTCRTISRLSIGGSSIRVHLSNRYSSGPVTFTTVTVGVRSSGASIASRSLRSVTFGGTSTVTVPANREIVSDLVPMVVSSGQDIAVSNYMATSVPAFANHVEGKVDHYCTDLYGSGGDHSSDLTGSAFPNVSTNNAWVSAVDVEGGTGAVVAIGDSITDGVGSTPNTYSRYPDALSNRLRAAGSGLSVVNEGISGNTVVASGGVGTPAVSRFTRDVLSQAGVTTVLLMEGSNDIALNASAQSVEQGLLTIADAGHAAGFRVIIGTILPRHGGWRGNDAAKDAVRDDVNSFIRSSNRFDGVVDFATPLTNSDPNYPTQANPDYLKYLKPSYDSGDKVHPNDAGYAAMANAVNIASL